MGTTTQGSRQAKDAAACSDDDSVPAGVSSLFSRSPSMPLSRAPERDADELDGGWEDEEENSRPSAVEMRMPTDALAPARVPFFGAASRETENSTLRPQPSVAPLSRPPTLSDDESEWEPPAAVSADSGVAGLATPTQARESKLGRNDEGGFGESQLDRSFAVSAPAIDITIEPSFPRATQQSHGSDDLGPDPAPPPSRVRLNPPSSGRAPHEFRTGAVETGSGRNKRRWKRAARVAGIAILAAGTIYLAQYRSMGQSGGTPPIQALPHLALPKPPTIALAKPMSPEAVNLANLETSPETTDEATARAKPATQRPVHGHFARPALIVAPPLQNEPTAPESARPPTAVLDQLISAPQATVSDSSAASRP